jgi:hypothetical protein
VRLYHYHRILVLLLRVRPNTSQHSLPGKGAREDANRAVPSRAVYSFVGINGCLCDLDPTHRVLRVAVTARVLTDEQLTDVYRLLERLASQDGPYSGIFDLSPFASPGTAQIAAPRLCGL